MTNRSALFFLLSAIVIAAALISVCASRWYKGPVQLSAKQEVQEKRATDRLRDDEISSSSHKSQAKPPPSVRGLDLTKNDQDNLAKIITAFNAPISFYGRVIDQYGQPVSDAKIHYSAADQYFGDSSKREGTSAADGTFSINGIKGAGLYVSVYKDGYDGTPRSGAGFGYGVPTGNRPPSEASPAVFLLRKKGLAVPLLVISSRQYEIPKTGQSVGVSLKTGRKVAIEQADIEVQKLG